MFQVQLIERNMAMSHSIVPREISERRSRDRFALDVACRFWFQHDDSSVSFGVGRTIDLSAEGVRIASAARPTQGCLVRLEVDLKSRRLASPYNVLGADGTGATLMVEGEGRIVWSHLLKNEFGAQICFSPIHRRQIFDQDAEEDEKTKDYPQ